MAVLYVEWLYLYSVQDFGVIQRRPVWIRCVATYQSVPQLAAPVSSCLLSMKSGPMNRPKIKCDTKCDKMWKKVIECDDWNPIQVLRTLFRASLATSPALIMLAVILRKMPSSGVWTAKFEFLNWVRVTDCTNSSHGKVFDFTVMTVTSQSGGTYVLTIVKITSIISLFWMR